MMKQMISKYKILMLIGFLFLCMFLMFDSSNTRYQQQDIKPLLYKIITLTPNTLLNINFLYDSQLVTTKQPYSFVEFFFRKGGHVFEYMILTFLLLMILLYTKLDLLIKILLVFVCAFLFACTDEYHQTFVEGRTGHFIDVYTFDLTGMILGIVIYLKIQTVKRGIRRKPS